MVGAGRELETEVVALLAAAEETVATAESLTGGLLCSSLVAIPGASSVVRGGMVVYHPDLKVELAGVSANLLALGGSVQSEVAVQLAEGARSRCGASWGIGTTGVAGPGPAEGEPAGTVYIAVADERVTVSRRLELGGGRDQVREGAVRAALELFLSRLRDKKASNLA